ncbi:hypothetical protein XCR1_980057 [Xenorhabdus cabanillasii JM26]|uniref:Uncharacterized protein n=1 Tax=Xenorhabdus cabanillasii JM26 TaxID=1427517 RepID=W1JAR2_9GAMM|nr:hypothetical protein XCR1_980057 [Xenorhabdus cabanillasii JM26]
MSNYCSKLCIYLVTKSFTLRNNFFIVSYAVLQANDCIAVGVFFVMLVEPIGITKISTNKADKWLRYL